MARTYRVTLKYPDGATMFVGTVLAEEIVQIPPKHNSPSTEGQTDERMTEPQKRYLFRLLAAQGVDGKKAEEHLKSHFRVSRLSDVTRAAASSYIDQLVKDRQDGAAT